MKRWNIIESYYIPFQVWPVSFPLIYFRFEKIRIMDVYSSV